jgi:geranylgeranyl pyrophosphate synthase
VGKKLYQEMRNSFGSIVKNSVGIAQDNFISSLISDSEICIKQVLNQYDDDLQQVLWEFMNDGKRLRPFILACIARMLNGDRAIAVRLAASVEIYHNATLIFDDVQDNSMMRRGKPTLNARFGSGIAISYASVLRSMMTKPLTDFLPVNNSLHIYQWIHKVAILLSLGQYHEMMWSYRKDFHVSEKDYLEMARCKTGALIGLSALWGGISASSEEIEKLFEFGCNLGIAYQIIDDIGNVDEKTKQKKDKYSDIYERKITLLVVHALEENQVKWRNDLTTIFSKTEIMESDVLKVLQIFKDSHTIDYCRKVANHYVQNAIDLLLQIPVSDSIFRDKFITEIKELFIHA